MILSEIERVEDLGVVGHQVKRVEGAGERSHQGAEHGRQDPPVPDVGTERARQVGVFLERHEVGADAASPDKHIEEHRGDREGEDHVVLLGLAEEVFPRHRDAHAAAREVDKLDREGIDRLVQPDEGHGEVEPGQLGGDHAHQQGHQGVDDQPQTTPANRPTPGGWW